MITDREVQRLMDSISADDMSAGITRAINEIESAVRVLAAKETALADTADALHRTSIALTALRNETATARNATLAKLRQRGMSYGRIADSLGMNRSNLIALLRKR